MEGLELIRSRGDGIIGDLIEGEGGNWSFLCIFAVENSNYQIHETAYRMLIGDFRYLFRDDGDSWTADEAGGTIHSDSF